MSARNRPLSTVDPVDHLLQPGKTRVLFGPGRVPEAGRRGPVADMSGVGGGGGALLDRGEVVDRYVVLERVGQGAMGVVYAAYDPELERKVALKLLSPQAEEDQGDASRTLLLLREAQALARVAHPNVVAVYDIGTRAQQVWIAMEFVAGQTLRAWASEQRRAWPEVLRILIDVSRGVAAAHGVGLVHRDVKPDNVMIDASGRVRVMDFGLAHARTPGEERAAGTPGSEGFRRPGASALHLVLTQSGAVNGTPAYLAPEQWGGAGASARTDQFGWSVMAWELLFGERPFAGGTMEELAAAVMSGRRRPPPRGRRAPGWLRRIVERGLAGEPWRRWPSMTALVTALKRGGRRAQLRTAMSMLVGAALLGAGVEGYRLMHEAESVTSCLAVGAGAPVEAGRDARRRELRAAPGGTAYASAVRERTRPWLYAYADR